MQRIWYEIIGVANKNKRYYGIDSFALLIYYADWLESSLNAGVDCFSQPTGQTRAPKAISVSNSQKIRLRMLKIWYFL